MRPPFPASPVVVYAHHFVVGSLQRCVRESVESWKSASPLQTPAARLIFWIFPSSSMHLPLLILPDMRESRRISVKLPQSQRHFHNGDRVLLYRIFSSISQIPEPFADIGQDTPHPQLVVCPRLRLLASTSIGFRSRIDKSSKQKGPACPSDKARSSCQTVRRSGQSVGPYHFTLSIPPQRR